VLDLRFSDPQLLGADASGAKNNAVLVQAQPKPGAEGTAMDFAGMPGNIIVVQNARSLQSDHLTAEVWINTQTRLGNLLVGKWDPAKRCPAGAWR